MVIGLDEESHLVSAAIQSSPSALLNRAAIEAARASTFRTEVRDCRPITAKYVYSVTFGG